MTNTFQFTKPNSFKTFFNFFNSNVEYKDDMELLSLDQISFDQYLQSDATLSILSEALNNDDVNLVNESLNHFYSLPEFYARTKTINSLIDLREKSDFSRQVFNKVFEKLSSHKVSAPKILSILTNLKIYEIIEALIDNSENQMFYEACVDQAINKNEAELQNIFLSHLNNLDNIRSALSKAIQHNSVSTVDTLLPIISQNLESLRDKEVIKELCNYKRDFEFIKNSFAQAISDNNIEVIELLLPMVRNTEYLNNVLNAANLTPEMSATISPYTSLITKLINASLNSLQSRFEDSSYKVVNFASKNDSNNHIPFAGSDIEVNSKTSESDDLIEDSKLESLDENNMITDLPNYISETDHDIDLGYSSSDNDFISDLMNIHHISSVSDDFHVGGGHVLYNDNNIQTYKLVYYQASKSQQDLIVDFDDNHNQLGITWVTYGGHIVGHSIEGIQEGEGYGRVLGYNYDELNDITTVSPFDHSFEIYLVGKHHLTDQNLI